MRRTWRESGMPRGRAGDAWSLKLSVHFAESEKKVYREVGVV